MTDDKIDLKNANSSPSPAELLFHEPAAREEKVLKSGLFNRVFAWKKLSAQNENSIAKLNAKIDELETSCQNIHEELSIETEGHNQQKEKYCELKEDYTSTLSRLTTVEKQFAVASEKKEALERQVASLTEKYAALDAKYESLTQEKGDLSRKLYDEQKASAAVSAARNEVEKQFAVAAEKNISLEQQVVSLTESLTALGAKYDALTVTNGDLSKKYYEEMKKVSAEQECTANLSANVERLSAENEALSGKLAEKEAEVAKASETLEKLQAEKEAESKKLLLSWQEHPATIVSDLDALAEKYDLIKISPDDYQYAGSPQNVFLFCKQYTIFDAISPATLEDLPEFQKQVREYADSMKKYFKTEHLRQDAYLVIPTSTAAVMDTFTYYYPDYTVHVITPEVLLPVLKMLQNLETYDFAQEITKEGQEKICELLAKLSLTTKKKVELDTYFSKSLITTLKEIKTLPTQYTKEIARCENRSKIPLLEAIDSKVDSMAMEFSDYTIDGPKENDE